MTGVFVMRDGIRKIANITGVLKEIEVGGIDGRQVLEFCAEESLTLRFECIECCCWHW